MDSTIHPFTPEIAHTDIEDLQQRLARTRFPDPETVEDWSQGIPLQYVQELCTYWQQDYDHERAINSLRQWPNFVTSIDDIDVHFIHVRSAQSDATPLLLTHGWPGSVLEFRYLIDRLVDPASHGDPSDQAFHVVVPSLPGYGFSGKPRAPGTDVNKIARMWDSLMQRLGYTRYLAHGGDWGAIVTQALGVQKLPGCVGIHITLPLAAPDVEQFPDITEKEAAALAAFEYYQNHDSGYSKQQSTRPQTLGYGLADSPVGQMAWIIEKFAQWTDCVRNGYRHPENAVSRDDMLDTVMLYWLTNAGASSARLYWESFNSPDMSAIEIPTGITLFPTEIMRLSQRWADQRFSQLLYFNDDIAEGGHFAALEQPETLARELWQWYTALNQQGVTV